MRISNTSVLALAISTLTACYPMEQASLAYSSSHQIGVGVTAGTAETPGLILNIGYRGLNMAYVPVAVAKHCPRGSERACDQITYRLMRLVGANNRGIFSSSDRNNIDVLQVAIDNAERAREVLRQTIARDERLKERADGAPARLAILHTEQASLTAPGTERTSEQEARLTQLTSEIAELSALEAPAVIQTRIDNNISERDRVDAGLADDRRQLAALVQARNSRNTDNTTDAFSVFGSFDGSAQGNSTSGGIVAGQIFSTGVAAQHLTRGMRQTAIATACFSSVAELAPHVTEAERNQFIRDGIEMCRGTLAVADDAH